MPTTRTNIYIYRHPSHKVSDVYYVRFLKAVPVKYLCTKQGIMISQPLRYLPLPSLSWALPLPPPSSVLSVQDLRQTGSVDWKHRKWQWRHQCWAPSTNQTMAPCDRQVVQTWCLQRLHVTAAVCVQGRWRWWRSLVESRTWRQTDPVYVGWGKHALNNVLRLVCKSRNGEMAYNECYYNFKRRSYGAKGVTNVDLASKWQNECSDNCQTIRRS